MFPGTQLRRILRHGFIVVPGAFDSLSALIIERIGFKAIYISGAAQSVTQLGLPDVGHVMLSDMTRVVKNIRRVVSVPLIVDIDTGLGGIHQLPKTIHTLESAGAAAVQIEDQVFPKRCGHLKGKSVVSIEEMVKKITVAVKSRRNKDFLIVARTDARGVLGMNEALRRARAYKKAGADILFPEALQSVQEFSIFGKNGLGSLMANMTEFGLSPALTAKELAKMGYRVILFPMTTCRIAAQAMDKALRKLKIKGTSQSMLSDMQSRQNSYKLIHYQP